MKKLDTSHRRIGLWPKIVKYGLYLFVFLLPWQTRWIYQEAYIKGEIFEYGRLSLYATEIILIIILALGFLSYILKRKGNKEQFIADFKYELKSIWLWLILLAFFSVLTIIWSANKELAWYGWLKLVEGLGLFWLINKRADLKANISNIFIAAGLGQALLGIYQFLAQRTFACKWLGLSLNHPSSLGTSVVEFADQRWLRAYGALPHPNILGGFLAISLILVIINLWNLNRQVNGQTQIAKKYYYLNLFYWTSFIFIAFGLLISFSRSAWLGFAVSFLILFFSPIFKKDKIKRIVNYKIITALAAIGILFIVGFPVELITTRIKSDTRLERTSIIERQTALNQSESIIKDSWFKGVGLNNYLTELNNRQSDLEWWQFQPVHNIYLMVLAELGIGGLIFFLLFIIWLFKNSSQYWPLIICLLIIGLFDHYLWTLYFGLMLWWLSMTLAYKD